MPTNDSSKQLHQIVQKNIENFKHIVSVLDVPVENVFSEAFSIGKSIAMEAGACSATARAQILSLSSLGLTSEQLEQVHFQIATHYHWSIPCWRTRNEKIDKADKVESHLIEKLLTSSKEGFLSSQFLQNELGLSESSVYKALLHPVCKEVISNSEKMIQKSHLYAFMFMDEYIVNAPFFFTSVLAQSHDLTNFWVNINEPKPTVSSDLLILGGQLMVLTKSMLELTSTRANNDERRALTVLKASLEDSVWSSANETLKLEKEVPETSKSSKALPGSLLIGNKNLGETFGFLQKRAIEEIVELKTEKKMKNGLQRKQ